MLQRGPVPAVSGWRGAALDPGALCACPLKDLAIPGESQQAAGSLFTVHNRGSLEAGGPPRTGHSLGQTAEPEPLFPPETLTEGGLVSWRKDGGGGCWPLCGPSTCRSGLGGKQVQVSLTKGCHPQDGAL